MTTSGGRRLAIVVATTEYDDSRLARLAAPLSDALELARTLSEHGSFDVESLVNAEAQTVQRRLERFAKAGKQKSDTLFVYLTGHGVKDEDGNLYFALRDTDRDLLRTTALSAELLGAILNESPAGSQVLMLDCCYSGAIARALRPKGEPELDIGGTFGGGRGRVVLAASGAIEQAWEGEGGSLYTHAIVEGIQTGAADLDNDGRITASDLHDYAVDRLRTEGRQSPRKFEFDDAGKLVIARPGQRAPTAVAASTPKKATLPPPSTDSERPSTERPSTERPSTERPSTERIAPVSTSSTPPKERRRRGAPAWIPGMLAVALATLLGTLWLTGAIGFLPSPFATTTTTIAAAPPTTTAPAPSTTAPVVESATTVLNSASTTVTEGATTTTAAPVAELQVVFEDDFISNTNGWADDDFSDADGSSFYHMTGGAYEAGYSLTTIGQTYYSLVPFTPGTGLYYIETEVTSLEAGSQCGLALQTQSGPLLAMTLGDGQVIARLYADGDLADEGNWDVSVVEPNQNEIGMWVDGASVTIYVDDVALDTFDEPRVAGVSQIGVSISGGTDAYCSYNYVMVWNG